MSICTSCRSWKGCNGLESYRPGDIQFCFSQVVWLIATFLRAYGDEIVAVVDWPNKPSESGYTTAPLTQHTLNTRPGYQMPADIIGELHARLDAAGRDGHALVTQVMAQVQRFSSDALAARGYCAGRKRKRLSFAAWKKQRKFRRKMTTKKYSPPNENLKVSA